MRLVVGEKGALGEEGGGGAEPEVGYGVVVAGGVHGFVVEFAVLDASGAKVVVVVDEGGGGCAIDGEGGNESLLSGE